MRNIDLRGAYASIYENRMAAMTAGESEGKKMMKSSPAKVSGKGAYTMKGKDGKPLFKEEEQINEVAPIVAAAAGKMAGGLAAKGAAAGAAKAGGGLAKAASSNLGKKAILKGGDMVGNKVKDKLSDKKEEVEIVTEEGKKDACYHKVKSRYDVWPSAYASGALVKCRKKGAKNWGNSSKKEEFEAWFTEMVDENYNVEEFSEIELADIFDEGYKPLPKEKMQDKAAMKPDTARGESQARKMDTVRKATKAFPKEVKKMVKSVELDNKKRGLERRFNMPSADNAEKKAMKNKAYKLENQRRQDLNKRYGPKKEELEAYLFNRGICETTEAAGTILTHMSDDWYETILDELYEGYADKGVSADEAMKRHGIKKHEGEMKVKKLPARKMRKGEGMGVGARKRQGAGKPNAEARGGPVRFQ